MTISEQHLSFHEDLIHKLKQFIEALAILSIGHLLITLMPPTQLIHNLDQGRQPYRKISQITPCCCLICTITMT